MGRNILRAHAELHVETRQTDSVRLRVMAKADAIGLHSIRGDVSFRNLDLKQWVESLVARWP